MTHLIHRVLLIVSITFSLVFNASQSHAEDKITMNMRDADIRAVIQWVADRTGKNIIVHRDVQGKVTVLSPKALTVDESYQVFLSMLQVHGYAAIETDEALKIVPKALATKSGAPFGSNNTSDMIVTIIPGNNLTAGKLSELVKPLLSNEAVVTPFPETNSLVVADHSTNISAVKRLIRELDRSGTDQLEIIRLKNANAEDVLRSINTLLGGPDSNLNLSFDERSNSLLMAGDPVRREKVRTIIKQLDEPVVGEGNTQVVYVHYVDAKEIEPILQNLAQSIQSQKKEETSGISIEASESANALVINAPPAVLNTMKRVVSQLDIRRAQVMIEALVVEVSGDVADDIGVSWLSTDITDLNDDDVVTAVNTLGDLPVASATPTEFINPDTGDTETLPFSPGTGITFGYFTNGNLQAAIRALQSTQSANILSTPSVVAIDNEEASLLVGQNVPFRTGQETSAASSTDNPFVTIERQDIGISLNVTPRINAGDSITLEIKQTTENIEPDINIASDIVTNKREILTKALIKDGQTLVLGGLIQNRETEVQTKVPVLGSMPLIGKLFSSTSTDNEKTNLMVFIRPIILKDEEHIASITQQRYKFMSDQQDDMISRDWGIKMGEPPMMEEFEQFSPAASNDKAEIKDKE